MKAYYLFLLCIMVIMVVVATYPHSTPGKPQTLQGTTPAWDCQDFVNLTKEIKSLKSFNASYEETEKVLFETVQQNQIPDAINMAKIVYGKPGTPFKTEMGLIQQVCLKG